MAKKLKRVFAMVLALSMAMGLLSVTAFAEDEETAPEGHVHSAACGYVEAVEGQPCQHTHDETCGYVAPTEEVPCSCTDEDGDGVIDHVEGCGYVPANPGQPCRHVHDETCGYVEAVEGHPCSVETAVAAIAALPESISTGDADVIAAARAAYEAVDASIRSDVSNYDVLTAAEKAFALAQAADADALLAQVPADLTSDLAAVYAAYQAVTALSAEAQAALVNTEQLAAVQSFMEGKDLFSAFKTGTDAGVWVTYDTTVYVSAAAGSLSNPAAFKFVAGTTNLDRLAAKLPSGTTLAGAFEMNSGELTKAAKKLEDGQEITIVFRSALTESLGNFDVYFISGTSSSDKVSEIQEVELQNGSLVIHLNNQNYKSLAYIGITRSIEYTSDYTTPSTAAHSYVPATHAVSSEGIVYSYARDNDVNVITVTIPQDYTADTVNVRAEAIRKVFGELAVGFQENGQTVSGDGTPAIGKDDLLQPGQDIKFRVELVNLSGNEYRYVADSMWMETALCEDYPGYTDEKSQYPTFDQSEQTYVVYRTWNSAMLALLDTSMCLDDATVNAALQRLYGNEEGIEVNLPHYYLDYYNFKYNTQAQTLDQLSDMALFDIFDGYKDTAIDGSETKETLPELNTLAYNFFYNHALRMDGNFRVSDYAGSVGAVMSGNSDMLESAAAKAWSSLDANTAAPAVMEVNATVAGFVGNAYMSYPVACDVGFTLEVVPDEPVVIPPDTPDPTPNPDPENPTDIPDENVPEGELPEEPGEEIPDENVPQGEAPVEEIPDEDVPQGEAPKTGDVSLLYAALAGVSGLGLAGTCLLGGKKRRED